MYAQHGVDSRAEARCCWMRAVAGGSLIPAGAAKQWDIFYSNQGGDWNDYARNWTLAKACFKRLALELNLKVRQVKRKGNECYIHSGRLRLSRWSMLGGARLHTLGSACAGATDARRSQRPACPHLSAWTSAADACAASVHLAAAAAADERLYSALLPSVLNGVANISVCRKPSLAHWGP